MIGGSPRPPKRNIHWSTLSEFGKKYLPSRCEEISLFFISLFLSSVSFFLSRPHSCAHWTYPVSISFFPSNLPFLMPPFLVTCTSLSYIYPQRHFTTCTMSIISFFFYSFISVFALDILLLSYITSPHHLPEPRKF